jgi:hypothetical protein
MCRGGICQPTSCGRMCTGDSMCAGGAGPCRRCMPRPTGCAWCERQCGY